MSPFELAEPASLAEALALLDPANENSGVIHHGGTEDTELFCCFASDIGLVSR